jgi:CrcB protein
VTGTPADALLVASGGAVGAVVRWAAERWVPWAAPGGVRAGTLLVNAVGSAALGLLVGLAAPSWITLLAGAGWCGGVTTFSGVALQAVEAGRPGFGGDQGAGVRRAAAYLVTTVLIGVGAAALGWAVGRVLR